MAKKSRDEILEDFINNMEMLSTQLPHALAGFVIGEITPKIYELLSESQKRKWKKKFPVHHGEAGVVLTGVSALSRLFLELVPIDNKWVRIAKKISEFLMGLGTGLTLEDIKDFNKWFKRERD